MMYILITRNHNGSYTFSGYLKRTYYGYSLAECVTRYTNEAKETGLKKALAFDFFVPMKCLHCGHEFTGLVYEDELGTFGACPVCEGSFDIDVDEECDSDDNA